MRHTFFINCKTKTVLLHDSFNWVTVAGPAAGYENFIVCSYLENNDITVQMNVTVIKIT